MFNSSFELTLDTNFIYTYKSQYLKDVTLKGSNESTLIGNNYNNFLEGNHGRNYFVGGVGSDTLNGGLGLDRAVYLGDFSEYIVVPMDEPIDSAFRVIDIVNNRDGLDYIMNIEQIEFGGELFFISDILKIENQVMPSHFTLEKPFPNPFNPVVNVNFSIAKSCRVDLRIYDIKGKIVKNITNETFNPGSYHIVWDAKDNLGNQVSTGVYYLKLSAKGHYQKTEKVLFLK
jgi:Ca2+-binding RTX toxin-like protein